ncbi:phage portal protein [Deltaproteobacteria bacterium Smac51]|nr:phage portal protein [Deltaproteobacteria bacterium Smac51]
MSGGRPITAAPQPVKVSRNAGAFRSSLKSWKVPLTGSREHQAYERQVAQGRAADISVNDWAANSGLNSITTNAVGTGLKPQSHINAKRLGISRDAALELQNDIEGIWADWVPRAHVRGMLHFEDLQFLGLRTMLRLGELVHLPVMFKKPGKTISLAIQDVSPSRLRTPFDRTYQSNIVDGIEIDNLGIPQYYWLATPSNDQARLQSFDCLASSHFTRIPAQIGHRPGCFHLFRHTEEEQMRGESIFRPGINLFRHLSDSLDNELLAQVVTSTLPIFIERDSGTSLPGHMEQDLGENGERVYYEEVEAGRFMYGNKNEKPHVLNSSRPSPNWANFSEFVLRAMAASIDISYEVLSKDFSKTNYSSARAALLEAWRIFLLYRSWLERHYCQPTWCMVIEEAWLSGLLKLPSGAPDFYDAKRLYTQATWIGPARGYVDPVKEVAATVTALEKRLMTYSEAIAERGRDFEEVMDEREEEEARLAQFSPSQSTPITVVENEDDKNASV